MGHVWPSDDGETYRRLAAGLADHPEQVKTMELLRAYRRDRNRHTRLCTINWNINKPRRVKKMKQSLAHPTLHAIISRHEMTRHGTEGLTSQTPCCFLTTNWSDLSTWAASNPDTRTTNYTTVLICLHFIFFFFFFYRMFTLLAFKQSKVFFLSQQHSSVSAVLSAQ